MSLFKTAATYATILSLAAATPIDKPGKTFTCKQVEKGSVARSGPAEMLKAFNKFGKDAPSEVLSAAAAAKTGSAAAVPGDKYDTEYLTPVTIGNTTMQLQIDTGSSDLWVYSSFMPESIKADHSVYDPTVSGIKMDGYSWFAIALSPPWGSSANMALGTSRMVMTAPLLARFTPIKLSLVA